MTQEEAEQFAVQMGDLRNWYEQHIIRLQIQLTELQDRVEELEGKKQKKKV